MKKNNMYFRFVFILCSINFAIQASELSVLYSFNDAAKLTLDSSENKKQLTEYEMLPYFEPQGYDGGAARFDSIKRGFITPPGVLPDGAFSFSVWVKPDSAEPMFITKGLDFQSGFTLSIAWNPAEFALLTHTANESTVIRPRIKVREGVWQHIAFTYLPNKKNDDGSYIGLLRFYVNGVLITIEPKVVYTASASDKMCIGARGSEHFKGLIDEYAIYAGVLTKSEINNLAGIEQTTPTNQKLELDWKEVDGVIIPIPPKERPRLYLRSEHIAELKERIEDPIISQIWNELGKMAKQVPDENAVKDWRYYVRQQGESVEAEMDAVRYLISKDKTIARRAITTALKVMRDTDLEEIGDIARASGRTMITGAIVYDWCYEHLTAGEKKAYIEQFVRLAHTLECGYPPVGQGSITGHSSEWMILRDLISPAIAIYDEFPEMYELTAGRILREHVPARNWFYPAHIGHQGPNYDRARFAPDLYATMIFDRMGAGNIFHPSQQFVGYSWFYRRRPDGQFMAAGDHIAFGNRTEWVGAAAMLGAAYYQDEYLNYEYVRRPRVESRDKFFEFLWRDTKLDARPYHDLPLTRYNDYPYGWMFARTGWGDDAVVAEMKVNGYNFLNHQHHDAGAFQIYYKGALAIDSGIYQGTSGGGMQYNSPHNKNYFKRTIAHNSLLIYDPDEKFESIGYGGANKTAFADNDGGQLLPGNGWYGPMVLEDMFDETKNYKTGEILAYGFGTDQHEPDYSYLKGDITDAYSDKVSSVKRSFVFLNLKDKDVPAALIVYDKVVSTNKDFKKYWLLHSIEEPSIDGQNITITRTEHGGEGKLINTTILPEPENTVLTPIGGEGKEFWVFGTNYENEPQGGQDPTNERGSWRVELTAAVAAEEDYFLNVMQVMDADYEKPLEVVSIESDNLYAVKISNRIVAFSKNSDIISTPTTLNVEGEGVINVLVTDLMHGTWQILKDGKVFIPGQRVRSDDNALYFEATAGKYTLLR